MPTQTNSEGETLTWWDQADGIGGPQKHFATDACRIERPILTRPGEFGKAVRWFLGYSELVEEDDANGKKIRWIKRVLPHAYEDPQHFGENVGKWLYASALQRGDSVAVYDTDEPDSDAPRGLQDRGYVLYTHRTYDVDVSRSKLIFVPQPGQDNPLAQNDDEATLARYVTRRPKPLSRIVTVPRAIASYVIEDGDKPLSNSGPGEPGPPLFESTGFPESGWTFEYIWHDVPSKKRNNNNGAGTTERPEPCVGFKRIGLAMNTVNKYDFDGFEAGTLMCMPPDLVMAVDVRGQPIWTITYRFAYLPHYDRDDPPTARGWNAFLRAFEKTDGTLTLDYRYATLGGTIADDYIFREHDFARLFRPEQP